MGFLNDKSGRAPNVTYLEWAEEPKTIRPLVHQPSAIWVHNIPKVTKTGPDGKVFTLRFFSTQPCTSTGKGNAGCVVCNTKDPLWHLLDTSDQYNRSGAPVHFPKRKQFIMPVLDTSISEVRIMKGGSQQFENMDKWFDTQPPALQNLMRCEWSIWKRINKTNSKFNKYETSRMDASDFNPPHELMAKAQELLHQVMNDLTPISVDALDAMIRGNATDDDLIPPAVAKTASAPAAFTGGFSVSAPPFNGGTPIVQQSEEHLPAPVQASATPSTDVVRQSSTGLDLKGFMEWTGRQGMFQGAGMVQNLIPAIKEKLGTLEYHSLSPEKLLELKNFLAAKFNIGG